MSTAAPERELLRARTHPKVLFRPFIIQLVLIAAHVALWKFFPHDTGIAYIDEWGQVAAHGLIVLLELTYTVLPALRWWNAIFIVTDRRLMEHWGVLYRHAREVRLDRIASITTERGILDRIFGCGTIIAHDATYVGEQAQRGSLARRASPGENGIRFHDIPRFSDVAELIDSARYSGGTHGHERP